MALTPEQETLILEAVLDFFADKTQLEMVKAMYAFVLKTKVEQKIALRSAVQLYRDKQQSLYNEIMSQAISQQMSLTAKIADYDSILAGTDI